MSTFAELLHAYDSAVFELFRCVGTTTTSEVERLNESVRDARNALTVAHSTLERDATRWRAFREAAESVRGDEEDVYLAVHLTHDVMTTPGATEEECVSMDNGDALSGADVIDRLWDAALATLPAEQNNG